MSVALINDLLVQPETATDSEGWVYLVETGEVVGRLDDDGFLCRERFEVDSGESADWVLKIRAEVESEIAKLDLQFAAVKRNHDARRQAQLRRLAWWEWKFGPSLIAFARRSLTGKSRTWQGAYGKVAFRTTKGSAAIIDDRAAVDFVRTWAPERVKVAESVGIKDVLACKEIAEHAIGEDMALSFLVASQPGENVDINTGVEIKGEAR